ncbi:MULTISPECIES: hypothetical protein [Marinobacter]|jgi:hypothetical protein|uniref:Uncharacterized protein n=1 Tax=Marinobacter excellens LAMA 842 TaxID=1306954 RepID=A0A137SD10_9GAMM|nr:MULTISPECIES: hypothetical protein [Marinobacter]MDX5441045.1 hypothetical protein [Alteromonadaceae bacterium]KXO10300.1 hypothetical protein J122_1810 [Marinobacter excellens LAMA 842]MCD1628574.1 hypothetical protein [Marinobacter shengliensis]MDX5334470.1 hypothetical protein [Marinobacter sp.]MDX5384933.1 hypothetical protein [Marinobacter sp.]|tara:strand:- start:286 stop:834 length:549 start_codon:yes stop_codon:yes gene_type:complete
MKYPRLTPWPFIDPDAPPEGYLKVGESLDHARSTHSPQLWHFFVYKQHLIIVIKEWLKGRNGKHGKYASSQYEYPIAGARWFVDTVGRFFLPPDHPNAVPRGAITIEEPVDGETLGVTRGAAYGGEFIPGYSFDNLNRIEHSTVLPEGAYCQMFEMGDPWLFQDGLFDLFKEIAQRHENGEF